jgi:hypothetical protein
MKNQFLLLILIILSVKGFAQEKISIETLLHKVWYLDIENLYPKYKYENTEYYLTFDKNVRYQSNFNTKQHLVNTHSFEYYFLPDSIFNIFISKEYDNDSLIIDFLSKPENKKFLNSDILLDFSKEITEVNVVHITREYDKIINAHLYSYDFYDKDTFNQYGYGWTPGQPQTGFIYRRAKIIPKEILEVIKKIKSDILRKVKSDKTIIYSIPVISTKMYILKNDEVEILEEKDEWLRVRYYGKKIVEGWIKKSDVE